MRIVGVRADRKDELGFALDEMESNGSTWYYIQWEKSGVGWVHSGDVKVVEDDDKELNDAFEDMPVDDEEPEVKTGSYLDAVLWEQSFEAFWGDNVPSSTDFNWATNYRDERFTNPDTKDDYVMMSTGVGFLL